MSVIQVHFSDDPEDETAMGQILDLIRNAAVSNVDARLKRQRKKGQNPSTLHLISASMIPS